MTTDVLMIDIQPLFGWLLRTTVQAGVLVCLILLAQRALRRWLGVRGRHCLWFLLLIRLALPWAPQSGLSVYNLLPVPVLRGTATRVGREVRMVSAGDQKVSTLAGSGATVSFDAPDLKAEIEGPGTRGASWLDARTKSFLLLAWLVGAAGLGGYIVVSHLRLIRIVRRGRPVTDLRILGVLEECRRLMEIRAVVEVIETDEIPCPALCGHFRPRLLLPHETRVARDRNELRHIFLHELAHLQRHDILIGYVASLLHLLHWFNPLVVFGLRRMRADRELVCDGLALSRLHPEEAPAYGHTVVRQIERLLVTGRPFVLAGLGGDRAYVKERIAMISRSRGQTPRRSPLTFVLVVCLASLGLTDGYATRRTARQEAETTWPTAYGDQHANIIRVHIRHRGTGRYLSVEGDQVVCDAGTPGHAGLWEARFDDDLGHPDDRVFFYSVAAGKYLTVDDRGNPTLDPSGPAQAGRWIAWSRSVGVWLISEAFQNGYLRVDEQGLVRAEHFGRDEQSYWDIYQIWRVKTSENPASKPQWRREHVPGPD